MVIKLSLIKTGINSIRQISRNVSYGKKCGDIYNILDGTKSPVKKCANITKSIFITSIKPIASTITHDVTGSRHIVRDTKNAYQSALNAAKATDLNTAKKAASVSTAVYKNGIKPHLAGTLGLAGTFIPLPLTQPAGYTLGKLLQILF